VQAVTPPPATAPQPSLPEPVAATVKQAVAPVEHAVTPVVNRVAPTVDRVTAPAKPVVPTLPVKLVEPYRQMPTTTTSPHHFAAAGTPGPRARSHGPGTPAVAPSRISRSLAFTTSLVPPANDAVNARTHSSDAPATRSSTRPAGQEAPPAGVGAVPAGAASSGFAPTLFFAVLMSLLTLAAMWFGRLRIAPAVWRSVAVVSLIERPG
jgi:hypothetical protein